MKKRIVAICFLLAVLLIQVACGEIAPSGESASTAGRAPREETASDSISDKAENNMQVGPGDETLLGTPIDADALESSTENQAIISDHATLDEASSPYGEPVDEDGTIFSKGGNITIVDHNGNVLASQENGDFELLYGYGDGFYTLYIHEVGFDFNCDYISIITESGSEIFRIDSPDYESVGEWSATGGSKATNDFYCGNGIFAFARSRRQRSTTMYYDFDYYSCYTGLFVNIPSAQQYGSPATSKSMTESSRDEYRLFFPIGEHFDYIRTDEYEITVYNDDLDIVEVFDFKDAGNSSFGAYSDGGFIYYKDKTLYFFDCETRTSTQICEDSDRVAVERAYDFKFMDGQAEIKLKGADGQTYTAIVDKQGNYIEEPHT